MMATTTTSTSTTSSSSTSPNRILFGSCNSQHYEQVIWPAVVSRNATAFVWAGDAIYADDFVPANKYYWPFSSGKVREATPDILRDLYEQQLQNPGYQQVWGNMTVLGAIDDHDYGRNNGDVGYRYKRESAVAYVNFLEQQQQQHSTNNLELMAKRAATGKGVYGVKVFDFTRPTGQELLTDEQAGLEPTDINAAASATSSPRQPHLSNRSVAVFLLDIRTHKTPWKRGFPEKYWPDYEADFLGSEQWEWFEQAMNRSTAAVNIVVQGLQVHADRYFDGNKVEDWSRFPMAQHRLYQTILNKTGAAAPTILVSGDVHMAELLRKDCRRLTDTHSRLLLEVTTSGLTHSWGTKVCARPNTSVTCRTPYVDFSMTAGMHLAHNNHAWTDIVDVQGTMLQEEGAKGRYQYSLERNFGEFEFDWDNSQLIIRALGEKVGAAPLLSTTWDFDTLSGKKPAEETGKLTTADFERLYEQLAPHGAQQEDWLCLNYRGHPSLLLKVFGVASPILLCMFFLSLPLVLPLVVANIITRKQPKHL